MLLNNDLASSLKRDALKTLNEMVSHQETMDEMIENGIVESASALLLNDDPELREQAALLIGSFVYSKQARMEEEYEDEDG